jgi:hypothetical protein
MNKEEEEEEEEEENKGDCFHSFPNNILSPSSSRSSPAARVSQNVSIGITPL